ncbi:MAG TPA: LptE family protein [Smithella sp.]|nr:LptE family protein [Smithella sp.]HNY51349.1 LptE family protein [Smithella sp.]HOG90712.1 LptE family protein [Smithella sp.]HOU51364.1 LptE family protein [Smithella sp.]HQG66130.1 LptE family protein [Smithella sp.]
MMKKLFSILVICISCSLLFGCGYSFAPRGESIDNHIQKIYVDAFENRTDQAGIENYIRTAFINQFIQSSRFKIASNIEVADAIVRGKIINLHTSTLSHRKSDLAAEERATMILDVVFEDSTNGKTIWRSKDLTDSVDYALNEDINLLSNTKKQALIKLSNDMAEKAFNLMMSGF